MMSSFVSRRLSRSRRIASSVAGGKFATTTSAVATSRRTISRPAGFIGLSVSDRLFRFICRNMPPSPVGVTGAMKRSSLPRTFSTRITSAPRSPSRAAQNGPAM